MGTVGMEEIAMRCPCCGHDMTIWSSDCGYGEYYLSCDRSHGGCGYRSPIEQTRADAVDRHNRLARIVEDYEARKTEEPKPDTPTETIESVVGLESLSIAYEMFIYAESLFCNLLENDWYEGNYKGEDVKSYDNAEYQLRLVLEWIRKKDPTFTFDFYTSDIVVHRTLGVQYGKLDHDALNAARALQEWMPEADKAAKSKEWWDAKMREASGKHGGFATI